MEQQCGKHLFIAAKLWHKKLLDNFHFPKNKKRGLYLAYQSPHRIEPSPVPATFRLSLHQERREP